MVPIPAPVSDTANVFAAVPVPDDTEVTNLCADELYGRRALMVLRSAAVHVPGWP